MPLVCTHGSLLASSNKDGPSVSAAIVLSLVLSLLRFGAPFQVNDNPVLQHEGGARKSGCARGLGQSTGAANGDGATASTPIPIMSPSCQKV